MIVDNRLLTHEQARVDLGKLPKEIGDKRQNILPAELQRPHPCGRVVVLSMTRLDRRSSTSV
jgi:hypothetical protein